MPCASNRESMIDPGDVDETLQSKHIRRLTFEPRPTSSNVVRSDLDNYHCWYSFPTTFVHPLPSTDCRILPFHLERVRPVPKRSARWDSSRMSGCAVVFEGRGGGRMRFGGRWTRPDQRGGEARRARLYRNILRLGGSCTERGVVQRRYAWLLRWCWLRNAGEML